ncbi:hypothetical protein NP233_g6337 [Leucocoprinus birnbaumii]|uniref:Uncharacterized protein n=1 Tax=Leucocoprinus birnbaumii TaxID=56174 RepID=A0AAD5VUP4_9AGAR|nr:hypothetical protein NP233_g6337 [Leucocoprinus birnbaumii]
MDITADGHWTPHGLDVGLLHQNLACLERRQTGDISVCARSRAPAADDTYAHSCGLIRGSTDLVTEFLDVCLGELLALAELFDPAIDFVLHFEEIIAKRKE